jgi:Ni,Fe-hydrogenase III small subunit
MRLLTKIRQTGLVTEDLPPGAPHCLVLARAIDARAKALFGRALAIRQVDAGSCNGCETEIVGLTGPVYDMQRFGLHFVASPRHADLLLVTGPVTRNMAVPLRKTYEATPDPKLVIAVGDCAHTCGIFAGSYAIVGPVDRIVPVDAYITGCPPEPGDILRGILAVLGRYPARGAR